MRLIPAALVSAVLLLLPTFASAQSLGEAAAKEREKRKNAKPTKIYTERDLRAAGQGAPVNIGTGEVSTGASTTQGQAEGSAQAGATKPGEKKEKTEEEIRAEQQKAWRDQLQKASADVARLTDIVSKLEGAAGDLSNPYGSSRTAALRQLEEARKQLEAAKQSVETLTEQGRRQGFR